MMNDDLKLLGDYAASQSELAFATLVERYTNFVYSAALRQVRDPHLAEEATQSVFIILARKADKLGSQVILSGWLYRTTHFVALGIHKREARRQRLEQEEFTQSAIENRSTSSTWDTLSPILDEAMLRLGDKERSAILLRFFENKNLREVGMAMGIEERAAQKRVSRGLEKLRLFFAKRGVALSITAIAAAVSAGSVQAASTGLAQTISAVAVVKGATASSSTLTVIKAALKLMAWTQAKTALAVGVSALLLAGTTTTVWHRYAPGAWRYRFEDTYGLKSGEVLKHIPPPHGPERAEFFFKDPALHRAFQSEKTPPSYFIFAQTPTNTIQWKVFGGGEGDSLEGVLHDLGLFGYEIEGEQTQLDMALKGDWTLREGAPIDALIASLRDIIVKETGRNVHFEKRKVLREVALANGHVQVKSGKRVLIYYKDPSGRSPGWATTPVPEFLDSLGSDIHLQIFSELTEPDLSKKLTWETRFDIERPWTFNSLSDEERKAWKADRDAAVLKHISEQTGLTFTKEERLVDRWFVSELKTP